MRTRNDRKHPALKHGAYSATAVLPGENRAEFEKLRRDLIAELTPSGALEDDIVMDIARLRLAEAKSCDAAHCRTRSGASQRNRTGNSRLAVSRVVDFSEESVRVKREQGMQIAIGRRRALEKAKEELGGLYELTELGEAATFDGLTKELEIQERLDAAINRCLKQLLMVRGVKSITAPPSSTSPKRLTGPSKAA